MKMMDHIVKLASLKNYQGDLESTSHPIIADFHAPSEILVVAFGGIGKKFGLPLFEFFTFLALYKVKKVFVRDFDQSWHLAGFDSGVVNIDENAKVLQAVIDASEAKKTIFIGNSAGGYAALLYGKMLDADLILSFSPQTFHSILLRVLYLDGRWMRHYLKLRKSNVNKLKLDLCSYFDKGNNVAVKIYYAQQHRRDRSHALQLARIGNVELYPIASGSHNVIRSIRDQGELKRLFDYYIQTLTPRDRDS